MQDRAQPQTRSTNTIRIKPMLVASLFFAALMVGVVPGVEAASEATSFTVNSATDYRAGKLANYTFGFNLAGGAPVNETPIISIAFPAGFSAATLDTTDGGDGISFSETIAAGGITKQQIDGNWTVNVTLIGAAEVGVGNLDISLNGIINPLDEGSYSAFNFSILNGTGSTLNEYKGALDAPVVIEPTPALSQRQVVMDDYRANATSVLTFNFTAPKDIPDGANLTLTLPTGFNLANVVDATVYNETDDQAETSYDAASGFAVDAANGTLNVTHPLTAAEGYLLNVSLVGLPKYSGDFQIGLLIQEPLDDAMVAVNTVPYVAAVTPGALLLEDVVPTSLVAGQTTTYRFDFQLNNTLPTGSTLNFTFPSGFDLDAVAAEDINLVGYGGETAVVDGNYVRVQLDGINLTNQIRHNVTIGDVKNPSVLGLTGAFTVSTNGTENGMAIIDQNTTEVAGPLTKQGIAITDLDVTLEDPTAGAVTEATFNFTLGTSLAAGDSLSITLPEGFDSTYAASATLTQGANTPTVAVSKDGDRNLTATLDAAQTLTAGTQASLVITDIGLVNRSGMQGQYELQSHKASGVIVDVGTQSPTDLLDAGLLGMTLDPATFNPGKNDTVTLTLTLPNPVPAGGNISVEFPTGTTVGTDASGYWGNNTKIGAATVGHQNVTVTMVPVLFNITTELALADGEQTMTFTGVTLPAKEALADLGTPSDPFTVQTWTADDQLVDQNTTVNATFEAAGSITVDSMVLVNATAGNETRLTITFTPDNAIDEGGNLTVDLPDGFAFDDAVASIAGVSTVEHLSAPGLNITFPDGLSAAEHVLVLEKVTVQPVGGATENWSFYSNRSNGGILDVYLNQSTGLTIGPAEITDLAIVIGNETTRAVTWANLTFTPQNPVQEGDNITILFPGTYDLSRTDLGVNISTGSSPTSEPGVTVAGKLLTINVTHDAVGATEVSVNVSQVINPLGAGDFGPFELKVLNATTLVAHSQNLTDNAIATKAAALRATNFSISNLDAGVPATVSFEVNATTAVPAGQAISVWFEQNFSVATGSKLLVAVDDSPTFVEATGITLETNATGTYVNATLPASIVADRNLTVNVTDITTAPTGTYGAESFDLGTLTDDGKIIDAWDSSDSNLVVINPGTLTLTIESSNYRANATGVTHYINVSTVSDMPAGSNVSITYTEGDFDIDGATIQVSPYISVATAFNGTSQLNLTFPDAVEAPAVPGTTAFSITLTGVNHGPASGVFDVTVVTNRSGEASPLDSGTETIELTPSSDEPINITGLDLEPGVTAGEKGWINFNFTLDTNVTANGEVNVTLPAGFTTNATNVAASFLNSTTAVGVAAGHHVLDDGRHAVNFSVDTPLVGSDYSTASIFLKLTDVTYARAAGTTDAFELRTNDTYSGKSVTLQHNLMETVDVPKGELDVTIVAQTNQSGASGYYTFTISSPANVVPGELVNITFPDDYELPNPATVSDGPHTTVVNATSKVVTVTLGGTGNVVLSILDVKNPVQQTGDTANFTTELINVTNGYKVVAENLTVMNIQGDDTPPADISDLSLQATGASQIELSWTGVGDDGVTGQVAAYNITVKDGTATVSPTIVYAPEYAAPGATQTATVSGLTQGTLYNFTVRGIDDADGESVNGATAASKTVGLTFSVATLVIEEGATSDVTFVLDAKPTVPVNVTLAATGDLKPVVPGYLVFNQTTWNTTQTLTVEANDDGDLETANTTGSIVATVAAGSAGEYLSATKTLPVTITDNEVAKVVISPGTLDLTEQSGTSQSGTYSVSLGAKPTSNVVVTVAHSGGEVTFTPTTPLTFTPANWNVTQTVTVTAVDDSDVEGDHTATVTHTAAGDAAFAGKAVDSVTVSIEDNDAAAITLSKSSLVVTEGGTAQTYTVKLAKAPTAPVTIALSAKTVTGAASADATVSPASLTFSTTNWNTGKTVTVTAVDDSLPEANETARINHKATSTDTAYSSLATKNLTVTIVSDDHGVLLTDANDLEVTEGASGYDTFKIRLAQQPTGKVFVTLNGSDQVTVALSSATAAQETTFNFTADNWANEKTIRVRAVDDDVIEGDHNGTIVFATESTHNAYDALDIDDLTVAITDDDGEAITDAQVKASNGKIKLTVTRETSQNKLDWELPTGDDLPGDVMGIQLWASNSPYTLLATYEEGDAVFDAKSFVHTGTTATATTKYLVTMFFEGDVGKFAVGSEPDTDDFAGTAADVEEENPLTSEWWFWLLIVLGIAILAAIVAVIVVMARRGRGSDDEDDWDDDDLGWDDDVVEAAPEPIAAPVESGEPHSIHCPRCSHDFEAHGDKPLVTNCPNCSARGILR